jgi:hypothetical protein
LSVPAQSDNNLNCDAYAKAAVIQNQQNVDYQCGFNTKGWSFDYQGHFNWCKSANVAMADLTREDRARANAIGQCHNQKAQTCQQYALDAITDHGEGVKHQCNFTDLRFANDIMGHNKWCMTANMADIQGAASWRQNALASCKANNKQSMGCGFYAVAAQDLRTKLNDTCPAPNGLLLYEAPQSLGADRAWCLGVGLDAAIAANEERKATLKTC